jgi:hypothetical protein
MVSERIPRRDGGLGDPNLLANTVRNYSVLLHKLKRDAEARQLAARVNAADKHKKKGGAK